jgi:hypothetical protein
MKRDAAICTMHANKRPDARARLARDALTLYAALKNFN